MKIKPPSRRNLLKSRKRQMGYHSWLIPDQPKKVGRLSQLNKHNRRSPSEFILMAEAIDARETEAHYVR